MIICALLAALAGSAAALPKSTSASTAPVAAPASNAPAVKPPYWLEPYSLAPHQEVWTGRLTVKNLARDLPRVLAAGEKLGAKPAQAIGDFISSPTSQQLVLLVPRASAPALLKKLRRLGELPAPDERTEGVPLPLAEVRAKIDRIVKERDARRAELAKTPAAAEIEEEVLAHLLLVEQVAANGGDAIRFNLTIVQR
jgi:hypothetical protein